MTARKANSVIPFTHIGIMLPFVGYLDRAGVPVDKFLRKARIPPDLMESPEARIPLRLAYHFLDEACRAENIDDAGLQVGRETSLRDLGEFGQLLLGARNVHEYFERGIRFIGAVSSADRYWLRPEGEWLRFSHRQDGPGFSERDKQHGYLFALTVTINTLRRVAGPDWCPPEVTLPSLTRRALWELSDWLPDARVITGSRVASFLFPASFLALPMPQLDDLKSAKEILSISTPVPTEFLASVRLLVESLIMDGYPEMRTAAEAAALSVRSLRRRLAECETSYSEVVAKTRIALAERWLAQPDRSITEIALALGYTDRSNFTRAFRRLSGMSPQEYREAVIAGRDFNGVRLD